MKLTSGFNIKGIMIGIGIVTAASLLTPKLRKRLKEATIKGTKNILQTNTNKEETELKNSYLKEENDKGTNMDTKLLYEEIKKERQQLEKLVSTIKEMSEEENKENS